MWDLTKIEFKDEKAYLSNMYPCDIIYEGIVYPSSEHLYQSFKSRGSKWRDYLLTLTPKGTKKASKYNLKDFEKNEDFWELRRDIMELVAWMKFSQNKHLAEKLLDEGGIIEERNC